MARSGKVPRGAAYSDKKKKAVLTTLHQNDHNFHFTANKHKVSLKTVYKWYDEIGEGFYARKGWMWNPRKGSNQYVKKTQTERKKLTEEITKDLKQTAGKDVMGEELVLSEKAIDPEVILQMTERAIGESKFLELLKIGMTTIVARLTNDILTAEKISHRSLNETFASFKETYLEFKKLLGEADGEEDNLDPQQFLNSIRGKIVGINKENKTGT